MARRFIVTVGTSLITNSSEWQWKRGAELPAKERVIKGLQTANLTLASAETNTLNHLELGERDTIAFLHSATTEGCFCAEVLADFYKSQVRESLAIEIPYLGMNVEQFARKGLSALIGAAADQTLVAGQKNQQPIFALTGGFKAEVSMLSVLAALLKIDAYYIHEQFRSVVHLPQLPILWDVQAVEADLDFLSWLDAGERKTAEVAGFLHTSTFLQSLVKSDEEHTYLNSAGLLLFRAAQARLPAAVAWPDAATAKPEEKSRLSRVPHSRPRGWEGFVERICKIDCVTSVRYHVHPGRDRATVVRYPANEPNRWAIAAYYGPRQKGLPLLIETTSSGEAQNRLVANFIARLEKMS